MTGSEHRFHPRFRARMARNFSPGPWLPALLVLWMQLPVEGQPPVPADRPLIFELHFEADSVRVVRNEVRATALGRAPRGQSLPRFPFPAVASSKARKVVWLNADGTIKGQRSFSPQAKDVRVSANGAYVLVVHEGGGEDSLADVELLDAQGTSLWRTLQQAYFDRYWSPTGETVVGTGGAETAELSFWGPQGKVAEYEAAVLSDPKFSADGRFILVAERPLNERGALRDTVFLSLFDKQGRRLWQRHLSRRQSITNAFISESGRSMAYTYYDPDSYVGDTPKRYLSVLNHDGDIVWTRPGRIYEVFFSEKEDLIVVLNDKIEEYRRHDLEVIFLDARTGAVQRSFPLPPDRRWRVLKLVDDELILGFHTRDREGDFSAHLRVYGPTGVLSWERALNPDTEDWDSPAPAWYQSGSLIGVSMGRVFQLFDLSRHDSSEE